METSVKAAEVLVPPQPDVASSSPDADSTEGEAAAPPAACISSNLIDPMEEFSRRLEDIISTYGPASSVLDRQLSVMEVEAKDDVAVSMETEISDIMQSLNKLSSPEQKLEDLVRKYAELAALRRSDEKQLSVLQQRLSVLLDERQELQAESRSSIAARSKLEALCRELQGHYTVMTEKTIQRCREDEEKRTEMANHFQMMLTDIQAQIEQHSTRNDKLCHENSYLTDKLEGLMNQCELRETNLEKINNHRELQHKLTEAKLEEANALLTEAEEKHKREKEYLLREAIDKTKKCFAMKEQELTMKKKLTLYAQKFDEFQATLAKSNEIYVRFKKEMDNMSQKMKKMDKESNLWKTRFENCNKALTDMIEERAEKSKEYDLFVMKIQKLEKLCRALQEERVVLYDKIKEVRQANANVPSKVFGSSIPRDILDTEGADKSPLLTPMDLKEIQKEDPVLTEDMTRLREEQAKLQEFAACLLATPSDDEEEENHDLDLQGDMVASAFDQFKTKPQVKEEAVSVPGVVEVKSEAAESALPEAPTPVEKTSEMIPADAKPEAATVQPKVEDKEVQPVQPQVEDKEVQPVQPQVEDKEVQPVQPQVENKEVQPLKPQEENKEVQPVKPDEEIQQQHSEPEPTPKPEQVKMDPPADLKPEAAEAEVLVKPAEVKPVIPVEEAQAEPVVPQGAPTTSESAPPSENAPEMTAASNSDSSKKQTPKKKKKRNGKSAS